jgi:putative FmdB family regulatory protein
MPTYEYACTACGEHLEVVQSFRDAALTTCPRCGSALRKVFAPVGVVFKGSGFYKTDSRPTGSKAAKAGSSDGGSGESSSGTADGSSGDSSRSAETSSRSESSSTSTSSPAAAAS